MHESFILLSEEMTKCGDVRMHFKKNEEKCIADWPRNEAGGLPTATAAFTPNLCHRFVSYESAALLISCCFSTGNLRFPATAAPPGGSAAPDYEGSPTQMDCHPMGMHHSNQIQTFLVALHRMDRRIVSSLYITPLQKPPLQQNFLSQRLPQSLDLDHIATPSNESAPLTKQRGVGSRAKAKRLGKMPYITCSSCVKTSFEATYDPVYNAPSPRSLLSPDAPFDRGSQGRKT